MANRQELYALDAEIHERVFGEDVEMEKVTPAEGDRGAELRAQLSRPFDPRTGEQVPQYSSDPEAAAQLVNRLEEEFGWSVEDEGEEEAQYLVRVFVVDAGVTPVAGRGDTYEEALCLAALEGMG